jgi:hypothetical protein
MAFLWARLSIDDFIQTIRRDFGLSRFSMVAVVEPTPTSCRINTFCSEQRIRARYMRFVSPLASVLEASPAMSPRAPPTTIETSVGLHAGNSRFSHMERIHQRFNEKVSPVRGFVLTKSSRYGRRARTTAFKSSPGRLASRPWSTR